MRRPPSSPLFPYTTLFRSVDLGGSLRGGHGAVARARQDDREGGEGPRPEGAVAVAQQHRDGAGIKVGHRQVQDAVAVDVARDHEFGRRAHREDLSCLEGPVAVTALTSTSLHAAAPMSAVSAEAAVPRPVHVRATEGVVSDAGPKVPLPLPSSTVTVLE